MTGGITLSGTGASAGLSADTYGLIQFSNVTFGTMTGGSHIIANLGLVICIGNYAISGGAIEHWLSEGSGATLEVNNVSLAFSNTPAFSAAFASATALGLIYAIGLTITGTGATGKLYDASLNGVIDTAGGGPAYLPGNIAGTTETGGQYA